MLGLSYQQIQKYEAGTNRISAATIVQIAAALNMSLFDLLDFPRFRGQLWVSRFQCLQSAPFVVDR